MMIVLRRPKLSGVIMIDPTTAPSGISEEMRDILLASFGSSMLFHMPALVE